MATNKQTKQGTANCSLTTIPSLNNLDVQVAEKKPIPSILNSSHVDHWPLNIPKQPWPHWHILGLAGPHLLLTLHESQLPDPQGALTSGLSNPHCPSNNSDGASLP